ncbi:MAG: diaminopimelate epimerase [Heliobacteriaceae bacterium]|jgi:diaminopimelate epimerase|nr:diaminopimelate epimerase [Heliobacteriaceae bacterium]
MKIIKASKMEGLGNDFVIVDYSQYEKANMKMDEFAKKICDRHFGIGADGLIIPKLQSTTADIGWYFYNSDGSTAQMCGNGMRCFAKYIHYKKIINKKSFTVETGAGIIKPEILDDNLVKVNMGTPVLEYKQIPFWGERNVTVLDREFEIFPVSMGNPHCVIFTEEDPLTLAQKYGPALENHEYFPEKTNVEFVKIISPREIELRVFERGCGITLACGTGACASVAASVLNNLTEGKVKVNLLGGAVFIEWQGSKDNPDRNIFMTGAAKYVFTADYLL